jgi:hypothetical protein
MYLHGVNTGKLILFYQFNTTSCCAPRCDFQELSPIPLQPSGHYMHHQFNIQQFYVQATQCVCVFCVDLRTNSDYFPIQP